MSHRVSRIPLSRSKRRYLLVAPLVLLGLSSAILAYGQNKLQCFQNDAPAHEYPHQKVLEKQPDK